MVIFTESEYLRHVVDCTRQAESEILVCCYEWAWYEGQRAGTAQDINRAICSASDRGVKVSALLHHDSAMSHLSRINKKTAARLRRWKVAVRLGSSRKAIHAKFWVFDGARAIICTHNISNRAVMSNAEIGVLLDDEENVNKVRDYFFSLWNGLPRPQE